MVLLGGVSRPGNNAHTLDALYSAGVKVLERSEGELEVPPLSEMVKTLMGLLYQGTDMVGPCQVLKDVHFEVYEVFHPLHLGPINAGGKQAPLLFPGEVHYELLGLTAIQLKVALPTPVCEVGVPRAVGSVSSKHEDEQLISEPL